MSFVISYSSVIAMTGGDFVFCNDDVRKIAASSAAMTGGGGCAAMTGRKWIATPTYFFLI